MFFASNAFFDSFYQADIMGKAIYFGLILSSIACWTVLVYKVWLTRKVRRESAFFQDKFIKKASQPLSFDESSDGSSNPYREIYRTLRKQTLSILNKNRHYSEKKMGKEQGQSFLSPTDIDFVETHIDSTISKEVQNLEENLYILSTVVPLAPFLGLLGTVWGILTTFSHMQGSAAAGSNQLVLGGLALALTTTVLGLLIAIPALIGYNYLKSRIHEMQIGMENFANEVLAAVELQYRQVDLNLE